MNSRIALPQLQSVKLGDYAFRNTKTIGMSNLVSLQSIEFGVECFNGANAFSLIGMVESIIWRIGLPQLQSIKLNNNAFQNTKSFEMFNLTSLQSIDIGQSCFYSASSFSLIGMVESIIWRIGLPQLQSIKLNNNAFQNTKSFEMSNLTSLQSIDIGQSCFNGASSFSLIGIVESIIWRIGLPQLQSIRLDDEAFRLTTSIQLSNLASLQSLNIGQWCFGGYFNGYNQNGGVPSFSLIGRTDNGKWFLDLPQLQTVILGNNAFIVAESFVLFNLPSLQTLDIGQWCFGDYYDARRYNFIGGTSSFSLNGRSAVVKKTIDMPQLKTVRFAESAFRIARSFEMSNLPSLESIEFGPWCFSANYDHNANYYGGGVSSFKMIGGNDRI